MSVHIQGAIPCDVTRFHVSLQSAEAKCSDKALYINPRFNPKEFVVFNTFKNRKFQEQERVTDMPFILGESFELVIIVTGQGYQVNVNSRKFYMFKHRMPSTRVLALGIGGDVFVESVNIMGGGPGAIQAWPGPGYIGAGSYTQPIPGGLKAGMSLYLRGTIPSEDINSFHINLEGGGDVAVHFNPRFSGWRGVVFNTCDNGQWQAEEKVNAMPFRKGESFELVFNVTSEGYQVNVDGRELHMYKHRVPLEQVTDLVIGGDVLVQTINIIRGERIYPGPGDVSSTPLSQAIDGGLKPGTSLNFQGTVHSNINRFHINLEAGKDVAMHFKVNFQQAEMVIFNNLEKGSWGTEERVTEMPFRKGEDFLLFFSVTSEGYQVIVNGCKFCTFKHRVPVDRVTSLSVGGNVSVQSITINRDQEVIPGYPRPESEQGLIQEYPGPGDVSSTPFPKAIDGGLKPGMSLYFEGMVHSEVNGFHINLEAGKDVAMHFRVYFQQPELVVFNSLEKGSWGKEERVTEMPFRKGENFQLLFNVTSDGYQVIVNSCAFYVYKHRIPVDRVISLLISGKVSVKTISIIKAQRIIQEYPGPGDVKSTPLSKAIDGGLKPGTSLYFQGKVHSEINRFHINLEAGSDIAMHFKVNFIYTELLAFNTLLNRGWQIEEKLDQMPFRKGQDFDLLISATLKGYQVIVNGCMIHMYKHRIPLDRVTSLTVGGDVSVKSIAIIKGSTGGEVGGGSWYNWRFLPMMGKQPIYKPPIPYTRMIPGGLTPNKTIAFSGRVLPDADRIVFNFKVSSSGDIVLHFNPRLNEGSVVRNSYLRGTWGAEERDVKFNPFRQGQYFEILIRCETQKLMFFGNGKHMFDFYHRFQPFTKIDALHISGGVQLSHILM
ncbi:uncharacterized protein LOC118208954 [Anguilla anguilla]|uniref:uncharacterized protein LOC118208954 n=1 Tax=Anguilla anguilla TaxID=7936 RepID=UPI0015B3764E|nr:uncharacterized protein LOC118208954 [Anguilla anguilla]